MTSTFETILADVETAILKRLQDRGLKASVFQISDFEENADAVRCPAVNAAFWDGRFSNVTMSGSRLKLDGMFYLSIVVQNVKDEKSKRHSVYPLVMASAALLSGYRPRSADGEVLSGAGPIRLGRMRKTFETKSRVAFVVEMTVPLVFDIPDEADASVMLTIAMQYMLKEGDDCTDAEDMVDLQ